MNLKFSEKVHLCQTVTYHVSHVMCPMSCVPCHVSHVTCLMSHVTCHMSHVTCRNSFFLFFCFFDKGLKLVGGGSVINRPYPSTLNDIQVFPLHSKHSFVLLLRLSPILNHNCWPRYIKVLKYQNQDTSILLWLISRWFVSDVSDGPFFLLRFKAVGIQ